MGILLPTLPVSIQNIHSFLITKLKNLFPSMKKSIINTNVVSCEKYVELIEKEYEKEYMIVVLYL